MNHYHSFTYLIATNLITQKTLKALIAGIFLTFFSANEAVCPPLTSVTGSLFLCIPLIVTGTNSPNDVGPNSKLSPSEITPCRHVPDTTVPTPYEKNKDGWIRYCLCYKLTGTE